ncbi:MAG: acyl carrier protein [Ruminococcus sp.]|nr:acyl carrier protein [Ruminococcus sp.]
MNETEIKTKLKEFICSTLGVEADVLEFDTELFGDSPIGLDSVDSLEIIAYVDGEYGVDMTGVGKEHFLNIDSIAAYILANK